MRHFLRCYADAASGTGATSESEVSDLMAEVECFYPASHLFWGLWALVRSADDSAGDEFDFYGYAEERLSCVFEPAVAGAAAVPRA